MLIYWKEFILAIVISVLYIYFDARKKKREYIERYTRISEVTDIFKEVIEKNNELLDSLIEILDKKIKKEGSNYGEVK
jgi:hypothetical protein